MNYSFTSEQNDFRDVVRRYFSKTSPPNVVRRLMETDAGWERSQWDDMNAQLGLCGLHVPECYGGMGFGFVELGIVLEEMGRALVCSPFFGSAVMATAAILNAASEAQKLAWLPDLAAGRQVATLAFMEPGSGWRGDCAGTAARKSGEDSYELSGAKAYVLDGHTADAIIVAARREGSNDPQALSLFLVDGDAAGVLRTPLQTLDTTRKLARIDFSAAKAELVGEPDMAHEPLARTLAQAAAMLASEMIGGAERLRESALDYANLRVQFGRQISSFQAMKHRQADMLVEVELAKAAAYQAAQAAASDLPEFAAIASLAKAAASDACRQTAIHAVQVHGGVGFTWENDTHLWFKRAKSSEAFLGDAVWHREAMMQAWPTGRSDCL